MVLMHVAVKSGRGKEKVGSLDKTYFGPVYPEAPPFKNPETDLGAMGVASVRVMGKPGWKPTQKGR